MKNRYIARSIIILALLVAAAIPLGGWLLNRQVVTLHARMAEAGGWTPENLTATVGQPLRLRLTSDDVLHSFAVGQTGLEPVDVLPGEVSEVTLTFDRPGKYTFYCTRWCGANHWRMRGVIEVTGSAEPGAGVDGKAEKGPLYLRLGIDLDAGRELEAPLPQQKPSAGRGAARDVPLPEEISSPETYLAQSPAGVFLALREMPGLSKLPDQDIWDLVAAIWAANISPQAVENGKALYATNCAACHGEQGGGDGVFAGELAAGGTMGMAQGEMTQEPADLADPDRMLSASSALLQGKILRGGMGTGMPYWGPIFTDEQTWDLVAFLWSLQFDLEK